MSQPTLRLPAGLQFHTGGRVAALDALEAQPGDWIVISPEPGAEAEEAAPPVARILATLASPAAGTVELFGENVASLPYAGLQRVRSLLGFVVCWGGLLSNRTLQENIALPLSVHGRLSAADEGARVMQLLDQLDLTHVAGRRPEELDGALRFRACVARALVRTPPWIVIEGPGDFGQPRSRTWDLLDTYRLNAPAAIAVCLHGPRPGLEEWIAARGGRVVRYRLQPEAT